MRIVLAFVAFANLLFQPSEDLTTYRRVVDAYRDGLLESAETLFSRSAPLVLADRVVIPASGWSTDDVAAAAMFHTETALGLVRASNHRDAAAHVGAAVRLLRTAFERDPTRVAFVRRWHAVVSGLLEAYDARPLAASLAPAAAPWLVDIKEHVDVGRAFESGLAAEISAAAAGPLSGPASKRAVPLSSEARRSLIASSRYFQDVLLRDPAHVDSALHLGRILILLDRESEAERSLRVAAAGADRPARYLAVLFLGTIAERQSRFADAEQMYGAAREVFRWGQSAPLAQSHVLMRIGKEAESRAVLTEHLSRSGDRVVEPLWTYLSDPATDLGPTLKLLRAEVWR